MWARSWRWRRSWRIGFLGRLSAGCRASETRWAAGDSALTFFVDGCARAKDAFARMKLSELREWLRAARSSETEADAGARADRGAGERLRAIPWWQSAIAPMHTRCRSTAVQMSERDLRRATRAPAARSDKPSAKPAERAPIASGEVQCVKCGVIFDVDPKAYIPSTCAACAAYW